VAPALCGPTRAIQRTAVPRGRVWPSLAMGAALWLLATAWAVGPRTALASTADTLRIATYNVHYGFDTQWNLSLEGQAQAIARSRADVVVLQEVDTGRLTSFGIDDALWLARRLGMEAVFLPTVEKTTGIALLTRLKLTESGGQLLPSELEPTGIVHGTALLGGAPLPIHGIWLGLSEAERARQLPMALDFIGSGRAVLGGDMNAEPDSAVYERMLQVGFQDPFVAGGFEPLPTDPAVNPHKRIDYVWIRGLKPTEAQVSDSLASDHRLVVVGIE
jgi:endonuclease/exonuclease/phosphatase family metal-dependent hydrolase